MRGIRLAAIGILVCAMPVLAQDRVFIRHAAALYEQQPDIKSCQPGKLAEAEKLRVLDTVNAIRVLHGLEAVRYDEGAQDGVMQIALMMAANEQVSHAPLPSWACYTQDGYDTAQVSNLSGGFSPYLAFVGGEQNVIRWLTDTNNMLPGNIGHRRWLLDPFLKKIAYGRVSGSVDGQSVEGAALRISYPGQAAPTGFTGGFVAYPFQDYPEKYYADGALLSFSAIPNTGQTFANRNVDYATAAILVRRRGGDELPVSKVAFDNLGFGVPNNIQFDVGPLMRDAIYDVQVTGVIVDGVRRDYEYWFRIVPEQKAIVGKSRAWKTKPSSSPAPHPASAKSPR